MKKIRTITENVKIKVVDKKPKSFKSDVSDSKNMTPQAIKPSSLNSVKPSKSLEKHTKSGKSFSAFFSATKVSDKKLSFFRKCLHFLFGITRKFERIRVFFGENATQDPLYRLVGNSVKTTKWIN